MCDPPATPQPRNQLVAAGMPDREADGIVLVLLRHGGGRTPVDRVRLQAALAPFRRDLTLLKWMVGANSVALLAILLKLCAGNP